MIFGLLLTALRLTTVGHPWPVHPDENEFVHSFGFPRPYAVHPPGYPLWVALGTATRAAGIESYGAYEFWSAAASCIGPMLLYAWMRPVVGEWNAAWAGLALGVNPLWWFEGCTALNYVSAVTVGLLVVVLCRPLESAVSVRRLAWAAAILGIGLGLRADLLVWAAPALLAASWRTRWRGILVCVIILMGSAVLWGWMGRALYADEPARLEYTRQVVWSTSVFSRGLVNGIGRNATKLGVYLAWSLWPVALATAWLAIGRFAAFATPPATSQNDEYALRRRLVLWWVAPLAAFQLLIHVTEVGHAVWYLPTAYVGLAFSLTSARVTPRAARWVLPIVAGLSLVQFFLYPWEAGAMGWRRMLNAKVAFVSAEGLRRIDERWRIQRTNDFWPLTGAERFTQTRPADKP